MKFNANKKLLKILGISTVALGISLPLISCSYYKPWNNNNSTDSDNNSNNNNNNSGNTNNNNFTGAIDTDIADSKVISKDDTAVVQKNANDYGLTQNSDDFAENGDFSSVDGDQTKVNQDILGFLNLLYYSNNKQISITKSKIDNLKIDNSSSASALADDQTNTDSSSSNSIKLNSTKITFELTATISNGNQKVDVWFPWGSISLPANSSQTLKISVSNQTMLPTINEINDTYYLGWKIGEANVSFLNTETVAKDLNLTYDSFSKVFHVTYNNLSNVSSYFDLQKKYGADLSNNLTEDKFKSLFESSVDNQQEEYFYYADMANSLISLINSNVSIDVMLKIASKYLVQIVTHLNIIPSYFESLLLEALYGTTNGDTVTSEPLINVLYNNKEELFKILKDQLGTAYDALYPIISEIKPGMTTSDKGYLQIKTYVDLLLNSISDQTQKTTMSDIIYGDILGVQGLGTAKSLWDIILTRYEFILNFVSSKISGFSSDLANNIISLLDMIFSANNGKYSSLIDSIFSSTENKQKFINILIKLIPGISSDLQKYLGYLVTDNENFDSEHIKKIVSSIYTLINGFFQYKDGATSETKYTERYANLTFNKEWKSLTLNKEDMTASYKYKVSFSLTKQINFDLTPIKDLISKEAFNKILKEIVTNAVGGSLSSLATSILGDLQGDLFGFIPDSITFGTDSQNSNMIFTYTGTNEKIWFAPVKQDSEYYNGFSVGYNMNVFYYDPGMWNSITKQYSNQDFVRELKFIILKVGTSTFKYYDLWKSILENVIMRSYNIGGRFTTSDYTRKIANTETYNSNYYYTNLTFTNTSSTVDKNELNTMFSTTNTNNYQSQPNEISWKKTPSSTELVTENIIGKTLVTTDTNKSTVQGKMYNISSSNNKSYTNLNYGYDFEFNPILNFTSSLQFIIDVDAVGTKAKVNYKIDISASVYTSNIYFPVNFYDTTNKKLVSSLNKNYYYFNVNAQQVK